MRRRSGLRPEYVRAYNRDRYGPWWSWRRWFKKSRPAWVAKIRAALEGVKPPADSSGFGFEFWRDP